MVQEHHARSLHWDLRLERDGVLVSWAMPKGIPTDPKRNHLAVHVEDHPLDYIDFAGEIPEGKYGAGKVKIWDRGTYEAHKFRDDEVIVTFHGERLQGKYALFQTKGKNWMIHRMDPPADPGEEPMPEHVVPMLARLVEAAAATTTTAASRSSGTACGRSSTPRAGASASRAATCATSPRSTRSCARWAARSAHAGSCSTARSSRSTSRAARTSGGCSRACTSTSEAAVRRRMADTPVVYMIFDLLYLDGHSTMPLPYTRAARAARAARAGRAELAGARATTSATARRCCEASDEQGLEGVVAKRLDSRYEPGARSGAG